MYVHIENYYVLRTCQTVQESLICGTGTLPSVLQTAVCQKRGRAIVLCINGTMKTFLPSLATTTISWTCCWSNCKFFERTMSPVFSLMLKVRPGSDWRRLMAYRTNELRLPGASSSRAKTWWKNTAKSCEGQSVLGQKAKTPTIKTKSIFFRYKVLGDLFPLPPGHGYAQSNRGSFTSFDTLS